MSSVTFSPILVGHALTSSNSGSFALDLSHLSSAKTYRLNIYQSSRASTAIRVSRMDVSARRAGQEWVISRKESSNSIQSISFSLPYTSSTSIRYHVLGSSPSTPSHPFNWELEVATPSSNMSLPFPTSGSYSTYSPAGGLSRSQSSRMYAPMSRSSSRTNSGGSMLSRPTTPRRGRTSLLGPETGYPRSASVSARTSLDQPRPELYSSYSSPGSRSASPFPAAQNLHGILKHSRSPRRQLSAEEYDYSLARAEGFNRRDETLDPEMLAEAMRRMNLQRRGSRSRRSSLGRA